MSMRHIILKDLNSDAPSEFQLLPEGKIEIEGEPPAYLDEPSARGVIAAFDRRGKDMVIDYEHQTLLDVQAPAAGWIKRLVWKGTEGLWAVVEWTARAREYLKNREYRYFSPVFWVDKGRKLVSVDNVALTNAPLMNNIKPIIAKMNADTAREEQEKRSEKHNIKHKKEAKMLGKIKEILKLGVDVTEDQTAEEITKLVAKNQALEEKNQELEKQVESRVACKEVLEAVGAKADASKEETIQLICALKAPANAAAQLSQEVATLTQEIAKMKQADLVALALKEGKTSPEELDKWGRDLALKSPEQFTQIVLSRPAGSVVPMERIRLGADKHTGGLDDTQRSINKLCGVDDETYKKYWKEN
jgi:phage I-like protein